MDKTIGMKLKELRGDRSGREVAEALGISVSAIFMWENDERVPSDDNKRKLSNYYGVSVQDIFFT